MADGSDLLNDALIGFTACICEALRADDKEGVCSCGITIGETYVPFLPDEDEECDADDAVCSQAWVRVVSVQPTADAVAGWSNDCALSLTVTLEVGILRCIEVPEGGEAPYAEDVMVAAMQAMDDMNTILCAALGCEVWAHLDVGQWSPSGPLGGQYGGTWTFTATMV